MIIKDANRVLYGGKNTPRPGGSRATVVQPNTKGAPKPKPKQLGLREPGAFTGSEPKGRTYEPPVAPAWRPPYPGAINSSPTRPMVPPRPLMPPAPGIDVGGQLKKLLQSAPPWVKYFAPEGRRPSFPEFRNDRFQPLVPRNEWTETGGEVGVQGTDILNGLRALKDLLGKYGQ